ncbi:unnamed protein product [Paramecium sonneborni]|uniref:Protein kinase domain-containing protein n=1 Tax=Paramecium sonneborni TaxID=65129 RepID=A0A8S1RNR5_9CILI|nr:unnamed protein product [Paramecium sonneborni]
MNQKLWIQIPKEIKLKNEKPILKSEFLKLKKNKPIILYGYDQYILLAKKPDQPYKYLKLDFETKFEIIRTSVQKKDEEDDSLGQIIGMNLMRDFGQAEYPTYQLQGNEKVIVQWREFLQSRINQWQFHQLFRVFKKIGKGNFASVYLAERIEDGVQMAIKAFSKQAAYAEENGKEAIVNELSIMRKLCHPHLMRMYEIYETNNSLYVGLEMLQGGSLYDLIKEKAILSIKQIQQILVGILQGLCHMHQKEIMHRDLKLENILFKQSKKMDSVVVADFGLATYVNEPIYLYCRCGTPGYVAPEVINMKDMKGHYSSVCDIYSLGLVFYLLITGKQPFPGKSYATVVKQNREANIDFSIKQLQNAPNPAIDLLRKMLEKDPQKRITANQCLMHPFLQEMNQIMIEDNQNDFIEEGDESDLSSRMNALNEESVKFEAFRKNQLINSPQSSPGVLATKQLKQQKNIDSQNSLQMNSPLFTGKTDSVDSIPNISLSQTKQQNSPFQASPMIKPSRFKQQIPQQLQQQDNPLLKYTNKKE